MRIPRMPALALAVGMCALAGCNGDPVVSPDPLLGEFPPGTFANDIDASEVAFEFLVGHYVMTFGGAGSFEVTHNGVQVVAGIVTVSDDKITLEDQSGSLACLPPVEKGTYSWSFDGADLTLTPFSEPCDGRPQVLGAGAWTKQ